MKPSIPEIPIGSKIPLAQRGSFPESVHIFTEQAAWAIRAALAAQRPLLVRGEPGTGKSQLARAAAEVLGRLFVAEVVDSRSESRDLQWRYDAVGRLGDAQALGASGLSHDEVRQRLEPGNYVSPGPLWWVFDWDTALEQHARGGGQYAAPQPPDDWKPAQGSVLLIDEIDKADADLPNGLLETLGNGAFGVPWRKEPVGARSGIPTPLVVITTNEERELPAAFVRRCLVLNLQLPERRDELVEALVERGKAHFKGSCAESVYRAAAEQLWDDRQLAENQGVMPPGQAEYLDMLRVVVTIEPNKRRQKALLDQISVFALKKHPPPKA
ncbi:AAA family ATPase [Methylolobus aquaticus]|nr:AAA family ATPase [Methylolobus aquaticus]